MEIHDRVLEATSSEALAAVYGEWATDYERDLVDDQGYVAPALAVELLLGTLTDRTATILDAGCGTGLVGARLHRAGCTSIDGIDYSSEMLALAREKGVYRRLLQGDLNAPIPFADGAYGACICVGTLTLAHVGPDAIRELVRVVAPGGLLCFTVRSEAWDALDYAGVIDALVERGGIEGITRRRDDYIRKEGSTCELCLFRVL
jgi:predicted TPR repeat methyltransferase